MALPMIPFTKVPPKTWRSKLEKKNRMDLDQPFYANRPPTPDPPIEVDSDSSSEYDLLDHLATLLPGEVVNGRVTKAANTQHLEDLRVVKSANKKVGLVQSVVNYFEDMKARERDRRKHHVLKEFEAKIKRYEEEKQRHLELQLEELEKQEVIEEVRRLKRIERNSRKKVEKRLVADQFTQGLQQRGIEGEQLSFYADEGVRWRIEGMDYRDAYEAEQKRLKQLADEEAARIQREKDRQATIALDKQKLLDDENETKMIETMMIRYGMINYSRHPADNVDDMVENIFSLHKKKQQAQARAEAAASAKNVKFVGLPSIDGSDAMSTQESIESIGMTSVGGTENPFGNSTKSLSLSSTTTLFLSLKPDIDITSLRQYLMKNKHKRSLGKEYTNPFGINFQDTGDIKTIQGKCIQDVGAISLGVELSRGACPIVEEFRLKDCEIRNTGFQKLIHAFKVANIFTLKVLDVRGNFLHGTVLEKMIEVSIAGIFTNLLILNLANNELRDEGLRPLVTLIVDGIFLNIEQIHLQRNSITNNGFSKLAKLFVSIQEVKCPKLQRLGLENNLITGEMKRTYDPVPPYFSL